MSALILALFLTLAPALASDSAAEARRLQDEMATLAKRDAWSGVHRSYGAAVATGEPLTPDSHRLGAVAALNVGDIAAASQRLQASLALKPDDELFEWKFSIDIGFAPVAIIAAPGAVLTIKERPFEPQKSAAIDHAIASVAETGTFDGLLPTGHYLIGRDPFHVVGGEARQVVNVAPTTKRRRK